MNKIRQEYLDRWQHAYDKLNIKQREAVDTIDGPVMVVAGPGTGKTQLLAVRIGNILLKTDVFPHNILCLTYTEAGAAAMRARLSQFIGPDAYNVNFYTFHAFCNTIINENPQYFGDFKALQHVSDIEEIEILRELVDNFHDEHPLKRLKGNEYFDLKKLKQVFATMKQEQWTKEYIEEKYEEYKNIILDATTSPFIYKRNTGENKKGDLNLRQINEELSKYNRMMGAISELENYNKIMISKERFDYQDMILWVIDKFSNNDDLLAKYQERYQYILVDEYQDTNGAQNNLLFLLADYWDKPNLFIVGDDDQSIFRFQGANMNSIVDFRQKYHPQEIVLTENYRSSQIILDSAGKLIKNNNDRLANQYADIVKDLTESRSEKARYSPAPQILAYQNFIQEEAGIIEKVESLHREGVAYQDMAIIYTRHVVVTNLVKYFTQKKIPVNVKKRVNVLYEPEVEKLLTILEYLRMESKKPHLGEVLLFEILHYNFWGLSANDIAAIALYCSPKNYNDDSGESEEYIKWRNAISNIELLKEANVKEPEKIIAVAKTIENLISSVYNMTVQTLLERILTDSNMLHNILIDQDKTWKIQLINTFFDFVKNESAKVKQLKLDRLMEIIDIMKLDGIELPTYQITNNDGGINFLTAFAAKGLEFEHVFIIRSINTLWENKPVKSNGFNFPPTMTSSTGGSEIEDERRLFYVAMTRAKNFLYISYPLMDQKEKTLIPSVFIAEIRNADDPEVKITAVDENRTIAYTAELMKFAQGEAKLIDDELIEAVLENFKISATSLNKYLKCKLAFYFENILRVPMARSVAMGYGNAIHYSLEKFFLDINRSSPRSYASFSKLSEYFVQGMDKYRSHFTPKEFENYLKNGQNQLKAYYDTYQKEWLTPLDYKVEHNIPLTEYQNVPISGKLDRVNIYSQHISVTDYKTGTYHSYKVQPPNDRNPEGGDYWRQIMFYRLLIDGDKKHNWNMREGTIDFVEMQNDKFIQKSFAITHEYLDIVGSQLVNSYQQIKAHVFTPGCGEEDCKWCNFVARNMPVSSLISDEEIDIDMV